MTRVTQAEFARMTGVNRSTVHRWVANGRILADAQGLIDPDAAHAMRDATESPMPHHQARKAQFDEARQYQGQGQGEKTQQGATAGATEAMTDILSKEEVAHRRNVAVMLEREWTAKQKEIEARRAARELCEVAKVRDAWRSAYVILRATMESLPPRAAPELAARNGDVTAMEHLLSDMVADALRECAATFNRKLEGMD